MIMIIIKDLDLELFSHCKPELTSLIALLSLFPEKKMFTFDVRSYCPVQYRISTISLSDSISNAWVK